jgi:hypothetical protein
VQIDVGGETRPDPNLMSWGWLRLKLPEDEGVLRKLAVPVVPQCLPLCIGLISLAGGRHRSLSPSKTLVQQRQSIGLAQVVLHIWLASEDLVE